MAGGTWVVQNKVRPGAYINFESVPKPEVTVGDRGIAAIALPLSWGDTENLIEVFSEDLLTGKSLSKVGFTAYDASSKLLSAMLAYCYSAKVYRLNKGGVKAKATIGDLTAEAKYFGGFGNNIIVTISSDAGLRTVGTYVNGTLADEQIVSEISELEANDYVVFSGTGSITDTAGTPLIGGTDGTVDEESSYKTGEGTFFSMLSTARWQTVACPTTTNNAQKALDGFVVSQRKDEGRYVQAVIPQYSSDNEAVINNACGATINGVDFTAAEFTAVVAGMTAGASLVASNTGRIIKGATKIIDEYTNSEIVDGLKEGEFLLSSNQDGSIKVEQDINSLHIFTKEKNYAFSKNRVMRVLDEIGISIRGIWESTFMGKVNRDADGLAYLKGAIISYMSGLQGIGAIQDFAGAPDVTVAPGTAIDSVVCSIWIKPVDSMEKLYMTVNITV